MKYLIVAAVAALMTTGAYAQQTAPDPLQDLGGDWQTLETAKKHILDDLQKLAKEVQDDKAEIAKLKAELDKLKPAEPAPSPTPAK